MSSLLFALVGSFVAAVGARDQILVARLRATLGPSVGLFVIASVSATATAFIAAWVGGELSQIMSASAATMFVAFALLAASVELAWPNRMGAPQEPTRSLGAIFIVIFARQLTDGSRFLVAALAVALPSPMLSGLGGAVGGIAAAGLGWAMGPALEAQLPLRRLRVILAALLFTVAVVTGMSARGLIG